MPTEDASAELASDVDVPGPRSRGSSDTVSPTVITLPSRACRKVADDTDWVASVDPRSVTDRAPYTVTGDDQHGGVLAQAGIRQRHVVEQRGACRGVPAGHSGHRRGGPRTCERHRIPLADTQCGDGLRVQPHDTSPRVHGRGVQPRGERQARGRRR